MKAKVSAVPPQSANCDTARSSAVTPNLNASRITRCPVCDCPATESLGLIRMMDTNSHQTKAILERRQCDRCGEQFLLDDDGVVS